MVYNEIIFSDKQLRAFGVAWKAAEKAAPRVHNRGLMLAHQHRDFRSCVLCIFLNAGIAFWIYAHTDEKR